jgi:hypothetical protein
VLHVRYERGIYIPEDGIVHSHRRESIIPYIALTGWALYWRRNVFHVRHELGFYIPEDGIIRRHRREKLNSYIKQFILLLKLVRYCWCIGAV